MVKRGEANLTLDIQLEQLGRFADTFPRKFPKTDLLKARAYKYLMDHNIRNHTTAAIAFLYSYSLPLCRLP